jgi:hypothetical protein
VKSTNTSRFICFGLPGLLLLLFAALGFLVFWDNTDPIGGRPNPFILGSLAVLGITLMLVGAGQWRRWGYVVVFLWTPVGFFLFLFLLDGSVIPSTVLTLVSSIILARLVRSFYVRRVKGSVRSIDTKTDEE